MPAALIAATLNSYEVPLVRLGTLIVVLRLAGVRTKVLQLIESDEYWNL